MKQKQPSYQFYPGDWQANSNLRRCTHAEKGIWQDVLCLMHDSQEYGVLRWELKEIAQAVGCSLAALKGLVDKGVMKGANQGAQCKAFIYVPRSGRKDGEPVTLVAEQAGPIWYSSRMVRDDYVRTLRGESARLSEGKGETPNPSPKPPLGEDKDETPKPPDCLHLSCARPSSSSSTSLNTLNTPDGVFVLSDAEAHVAEPSQALPNQGLPACPHQAIIGLYAEHLPQLAQPRVWEGNRAKHLQTRWRWVLTAKKPDGVRYATDADEALAFFARFFGYVSQSDWLMGRGGKWSCDLGWLVKADNFAKVLDGNYENENAEAA